MGGCEGCPGCPCRDAQPPTPPGAQGAVSALRGGGQAAAGRRGVGREASRPAGAACVPPAAPHGCPASGRCTDAGPQQSQDLNPHLRGLCLATNSLIRSLTRSQEEKVGLRCPCRQVFDLGSPLQGTPPPTPPQGRMPWSLFQKPGLRASTLRARPVEFLRGDERHQDGPRDFPAAPPASPQPAGARQMLRMETLSLTHQPPRGLWDAGPLGHGASGTRG